MITQTGGRAMGKVIATKSYVLDFGKHKGKTVNWVLQNDPGYILWLDRENVRKFSQEIVDNAEDNDYDEYNESWEEFRDSEYD